MMMQNKSSLLIFLTMPLLLQTALSHDSTRRLRKTMATLNENHDSTTSSNHYHPIIHAINHMHRSTTEVLGGIDITSTLQNLVVKPQGLFGPDKGVSYKRSIMLNDDDSSFYMDFDGDNCKRADIYGDNRCHFDWGETVSGTVNATFNLTFDEGDVIGIDTRALIYQLIPVFEWSVSCPACGGNCTIDLPEAFPIVNMTESSISMEMPPCPYVADPVKGYTFSQVLPLESPTNGLVSVLLKSSFYVDDKSSGSRIFEMETSTTML